MIKRKLGQGLEVFAIGFGCMGLNFGYGTSLGSLRKKSALSGRTRNRVAPHEDGRFSIRILRL